MIALISLGSQNPYEFDVELRSLKCGRDKTVKAKGAWIVCAATH